MEKLLIHYRQLWIASCHIGIVASSVLIAFLLRLDFAISADHFAIVQTSVLLALLVKIPVFYLGGLHRGWWRYVGLTETLQVLKVNLIASVCFGVAAWFIIGSSFPRSVYLLDPLICFFLSTGVRFAVRIYNETLASEIISPGTKGILVYGAGSGGNSLAREIRTNRSLQYQVLGFLDDDPSKRGAVLDGVAVVGSGADIAKIAERFSSSVPKLAEIVIAMPEATGTQMRRALARCRAAGVPCKTIPGLNELLNGAGVSKIRDVSVNDLLGRVQVNLDEGRIRSDIAGRSVLVTGAAGSIGSELCRNIARFGPSRLVMLDQSESGLFHIDLELRRNYPSLGLIAEVGDIRNKQRVDALFQKYRFDSVFHAAAYKHVPMMEAHPIEAVETNVLGTWNLVQAARRYAQSSFLMISSDKAVNPANLMGLTKRVAELLLSSMNKRAETDGVKFVSVRFGNVLGSNGSVIPVFQQQIAAGGPVTVTHPEVRRYFMTIQEGVQLVLQASTMAQRSEIFVLDMGESIRIIDLARNMIRLSGLDPGKDIEIRYTGLRPGEKLNEQLMIESENIRPTYHEKIKVFHGEPADGEFMEEWIRQLKPLISARNDLGIVAHMADLVPEYQPGGHWEEPKSWQNDPTSTPEQKLHFTTPLNVSASVSLAGRPWNRIVSIISPCRNEVAHIGPFLESVLEQSLPAGVSLEVLIADGQSDDGTREKLAEYAQAHAWIQVLDNPGRIVSTGLNAAIRRARGDVIVRMDAHTIYAPDYITECLRSLDKTGADNVGGPWVPRGDGYISEAIAGAFSSPFVSGGGKAHRAAYEGPVDTVYLGCWPRQAFEKFGLFDEDFVRTQDSELNLRILRGGGTIWQTPAIRSWYVPRSSLLQLARQYTQYGYWKARVIKKHTLPASVRHLVPGGFLAGLLILALLAPFVSWAGPALALLVLVYAAAVGAGSILACAAPGQWKYLPIMPVVFAVYQLSYGYGFWRGLIDFIVLGKGANENLSALTRVPVMPLRRSSEPIEQVVRRKAASQRGAA